MEAAAATAGSSPVIFFPSNASPRRRSSFRCSSTTTAIAKQQQLICRTVPRLTGTGSKLSVSCSASVSDSSPSAVSSERWLLEPAGDGDWRHIGYKVARPGAFEIASEAVTVGRVADKADIVLPVATVSGEHAKLEKKDGSLVVTDLGSTNGTYINERRLTPGFAIPIEPGSLLIFGDIHLAMFRVNKMIVDVPSDASNAEQEAAKTTRVSSATQ